MKNTVIIIPTRLEAKRFPNKPLVKINDVPIGRSSIIVSLFGYKGQTRALELNSAKEAVLKIPLIEAPTQLGTVDVVAVQSGQAKNEMATVSSRQFSVEETKAPILAIDFANVPK